MSRETVVDGGSSGFRQSISIGPHQLVADEPKDAGGDDAGPNPYELLLAALGACTNMTLRMYADRKGWQLREIRVALTHSRNYAHDCAECDKRATMVDRIERQITLVGELSGEQRERLLEIADRCPVHRTLTSKIQIQTRLADQSFQSSRQ
jgi:putative redox protein